MTKKRLDWTSLKGYSGQGRRNLQGKNLENETYALYESFLLKRGHPLKGASQGKIVPYGNEMLFSLPSLDAFEYVSGLAFS